MNRDSLCAQRSRPLRLLEEWVGNDGGRIPHRNPSNLIYLSAKPGSSLSNNGGAGNGSIPVLQAPQMMEGGRMKTS